MDWQPIETAPKDTSDILAATDEIRGGVVILRWFRYNGSEAWRDGDGDSYLRVTHWMPLPAPPADAAKE